ncbi:unnamed protein product [Didymodactylos carnosus]|uniref:3'-5' exonuclease domain-containing protein n=1 Tax=Didymodactylos carnosus TaxID=1234261 RepID=A0A8S2GGH9_9BILA|nr:unnamed protein product [Didymodactylos carnosus]CAF3500250.1 unnamed protein product [Didymodactylos carnosus]
MFAMDTESVLSNHHRRNKEGNKQNWPAIIQIEVRSQSMTDIRTKKRTVLLFQIFTSSKNEDYKIPAKMEGLLTKIFECDKQKLFTGNPEEEMISLKVHYSNELFQSGVLRNIYDIRRLYDHYQWYLEITDNIGTLLTLTLGASPVPGALVGPVTDGGASESFYESSSRNQNAWSLRQMVGDLFQLHLNKSLTCSNWSRDRLDANQIEYACYDVLSYSIFTTN